MAFSDWNPPDYWLAAGEQVIPADMFDWTDTRRWSWIRYVRRGWLAWSDWTQVTDAPLSDEERVAWQQYRKELRDVPDAADPEDAAVPKPPFGFLPPFP
jgi:hypothetical protein